LGLYQCVFGLDGKYGRRKTIVSFNAFQEINSQIVRRIFVLLLACMAGVSLVVAQKPVPLSVRTPVPNRNLSSLLKFSQWNALFPHRNKIYTYKAFLQAASYFPEFLADKKADVRKRELAAFLANIAQETSGGWAEAPGGYFKWGLYYVEEQRDSTMNPYTDVSKKDVSARWRT
jgi:hypothetical protein